MTEEKKNSVNLTIDGKHLSVERGTTVYHATKMLGIEIPIFCYHDRMPPFGACRVCLVEVENMNKLQTSCTLEATEGMVIHTHSQPAVEGRKSILELLLINHPLDCPICDKGGECPLQDQTMKFGPGESRFFEDKRHFQKPKELGPLLMLDRERCIICARCTRFCDEVSGDHALEFQDRGYQTEVCTPNGVPVHSKFIGNTISICPVGALTSRAYRFRARPWDNHQTKTSCTLCPVGCSMILDERDGEIMRTRACEDKEVNDVWLCDKGWFGYEFASHPDRLQTPLIRREGKLVPCSWEEALSLVAEKILEAKSSGKAAALGGNPLTTEENYLFQQLIRRGAEVNHVDHRVGLPLIGLDEEVISPGMEISIEECSSLSRVLILGADLTEEFPILWLRLREAINQGAKVEFIGHFLPEIASYFSHTTIHAPGEEIKNLKDFFSKSDAPFFSEGRGAIFIGSQYAYSIDRKDVLGALVSLTQTLPQISLNLLEAKDNSMGARYAGMRPDLEPGGKRLLNPGLNIAQVMNKAAQDRWDFLYVAGANLKASLPKKLWKKVRENLNFLVVQDLFLHETAEEADLVLPSLCFLEKEGTFINIEGRIRHLKPGKAIPETLYSDGDIFHRIAQNLGFALEIDSLFESVLKEGQLMRPSLKREGFLVLGQVSMPEDLTLAASFTSSLFDNGVRISHDKHLSQMPKQPRIRINPLDAFKRNISQGNKISIEFEGSSVSGIVNIEEGVAEGTVLLPIGFSDFFVHHLGIDLRNGLRVNIQQQLLAQGKDDAS